MYSIGPREAIALCRVVAGRRLMRYRGGENGFTDRFEKALCEKTGARHALAVNSGTSALICALAGLGIGPGDEVIVPAYTFVSTALAPLAVGAVPILADVNETLTLDPADVERRISPFTRAIIPVHMVNHVCDLDALRAVARRHGLYLVEDACQAVGVRYRGRHVGTFGEAGAFSFNQFKNISAGEGGAVLTDDDTVFERALMYHDAGFAMRDHASGGNREAVAVMNMRVSELTGAVLGEQLKRLDGIIERLRRRRSVMAEILTGGSGMAPSPHNDPENAVGLTLLFDSAERAADFAARHWRAERLIDSGMHVYTNWGSILQKRSFDPRLNPFDWARREITYEAGMCARTLDILERTCRIPIPYRRPISMVRSIARELRA